MTTPAGKSTAAKPTARTRGKKNARAAPAAALPKPKVPKPKRPRTFTEPDRQAALVALDLNGGNLRKTARETGVALATLHKWRVARDNEPDELRRTREACRDQVIRQSYGVLRTVLGEIETRVKDPKETLHSVIGAYIKIAENAVALEAVSHVKPGTDQPPTAPALPQTQVNVIQAGGPTPSGYSVRELIARGTGNAGTPATDAPALRGGRPALGS